MLSLLIVFFLVSIVFSFLCSLWEAALLSIPPTYAEIQNQEGHAIGRHPYPSEHQPPAYQAMNSPDRTPMFSLFKPNFAKRLQKQYEAKLTEAMHAQRNGDIRGYSFLTEEAEAIRAQLKALDTTPS